MTYRYSLHARPLERVELPRLLRALADRPGLVALDSAAGEPRRFSIVAWEPRRSALAWRSIDEARRALATLECVELRAGEATELPFHGGFIGALAYDLGVAGEQLRLPAPAWPSPPIVGGLYLDHVVFEHGADRAWAVWAESQDSADEVSVEVRHASLLAALERATPRAAPGPDGPLVRNISAAEHMARVEDVRQRIGRGELYQANVAQRFERALLGHPVEHFLRLREVNPAPYMGYVHWATGGIDGALLSASPELLLELSGAGAGRVARTRPIKGTAPRGESAEEDAAQLSALLASGKDRAELAMIVDLERNDLGRIAEPGSVRVEGFPTARTYASVHHLVADVVATPRADVDAWGVVEALFPGGSITGAPKLASMEAIAELEGEGRGFFTGGLGFVDVRGQAAWNILIRTAVWRPRSAAGVSPERWPGEVSFHVGGGITWRSDPEAEELETRVKGAALAAAFAPVEHPEDTLGGPVRSLRTSGGPPA